MNIVRGNFGNLSFDESYVKVLKDVLGQGRRKHNRTGIDTISKFNTQVKHKIEMGNARQIAIPASLTRKIFVKGALIEIMWVMGMHLKDEKYRNLPRTNTQYLLDNGVKYWQPWADENNNLGGVYGEQLTNWDGNINQVKNIIELLRTDPSSRRLVMTMWNPSQLNNMALPPCHHTIEFYSSAEPPEHRITPDLSLRWMQRSADLPIGIPYNILMYTFMCIIIAICTNHRPRNVYGLLGDSHIYANQIGATKKMIEDYEKRTVYKCHVKPSYVILSERIQELWYDRTAEGKFVELEDFDITGADFEIVYDTPPAISIPVAV